VEGYFRDIGTVAAYQLAQREWQERAQRSTI
jgi:NDP-sugar pyrophosphorylase family protein